MAYTNPLLPILRISFTPINEVGGHGAFVPLRYASDSGAARICQRVGVKARERSDQAEVGCARGFPTVGRFFENS